MDRIMLDLETMGNGSNAAIIAIGAVRFESGVIADKFEVVVDLQSCLDVGLEIDASTVLWWMKQSDKARAVFQRTGKNITEALAEFSSWVGDVDAEVWGNGAAFDNVILSNAYRKCRLVQPWKFWNDRCYRTVKNRHPDVKIERVGIHHSAVDDAETQALHLMKIEGQRAQEKR